MPDKRLMRSRTQKMWAGVCGGFAEYFNVDPVLVRLVVVVFTLATIPVGLVGYIVCMIVMPEGPIAAPAAAAAGSPQDSGMGAPEGSGAPAPPRSAGATFVSLQVGSGAHPGMIGGLILVIVGALLLMGNLDLFDWGFLRFLRWRYLWPTAMIAIGLWMLLRAARPKPVA